MPSVWTVFLTVPRGNWTTEMTFRPLTPGSEVVRGRDLHFRKDDLGKHCFRRIARLDSGPLLGRLALASEVAGGHTLPF
jgi:hypothetical protein